MIRLSVATCRAKLDEYLTAESKVLNSQSYSIGGRTLTHANLSEIQKGIELWASRLDAAERAEAGRGGVRMFTPIVHNING